MVETDYSSYAIVHELHHSGQELNAALQLLSGCHEWGQAPGATGGGNHWGDRGWGLHHRLGHHIGTQHAGTQGIQFGVNETLYQKYPRSTAV